MGQHRDAAGFPDDPDAAFRREPVSGNIGGSVVREIPDERGGHIRNPSLAHHDARDMGPGDHVAVRFRLDLFDGDVEPELLEPEADLAVPYVPPDAQFRKLPIEIGIPGIETIPQNMEHSAEFGGEFDSRNAGDPVAPAGHEKVRDPLGGIVVCETQDGKPKSRASSRKVRGAHGSVGTGAVNVEVDEYHEPATAVLASSSISSISNRTGRSRSTIRRPSLCFATPRRYFLSIDELIWPACSIWE